MRSHTSSASIHGAPITSNGHGVPRPTLQVVASNRQVPGYQTALANAGIAGEVGELVPDGLGVGVLRPVRAQRPCHGEDDLAVALGVAPIQAAHVALPSRPPHARFRRRLLRPRPVYPPIGRKVLPRFDHQTRQRTRPLDARQQLVLRERLPTTIPLHHEELLPLDLLVGGVPMLTKEAFPTTTDHRPFPGCPGIDDLVILPPTFRTTHTDQHPNTEGDGSS